MDDRIGEVIEQKRDSQLSPFILRKFPAKDYFRLVAERSSCHCNTPIHPTPMPCKMTCAYPIIDAAATDFGGFDTSANNKLAKQFLPPGCVFVPVDPAPYSFQGILETVHARVLVLLIWRFFVAVLVTSLVASSVASPFASVASVVGKPLLSSPEGV